MTRTRQVRLEPDVVALIEGDPDQEGLSLSAGANRVIRDHFSGPATVPVVDREPEDAPIPPVDRPSRPQMTRRRLAAGSGRLGAKIPPGRCPHPIGRRIGDRCASCGSVVR